MKGWLGVPEVGLTEHETAGGGQVLLPGAASGLPLLSTHWEPEPVHWMWPVFVLAGQLGLAD